MTIGLDMTIADAMKLDIVFFVLAQLFLMTVYLRAMRQRHHASFSMLLLSTVLCIPSLAMVSISYFVEMPQELATNLYRIGLLFAFPSTGLGVVGVRSLVKAYVAVAPESPPPPPPTSER